MSPLPATPVAARIASIQSRILQLTQISGGGQPARLGAEQLAPSPGFAHHLAQEVARQPGAAGLPATPGAGAAPPLPLPGLPGTIGGTRPPTGPAGSSAGGLTGPIGRPSIGAAGGSNGPVPRPTVGAIQGATGPIPRPGGQAPDPLAPGSDFGAAVVALAQRELGTPYVWGGESDAEGGYDCSGLLWHAYRQAGIELPRVSRDQARVGEPVASLDQARPGDLVAFGNPVDHIGMYAGDGMMVVAPHTGAVVRMQAITQTPTAIRRIVPAGTVVAGPGAGQAPAAVPAPAVGGPGGPLVEVPFAAELNAAAARHGIDPRLLAAVASTESAFRPDAVSPAGAQGLMQIMPATARHLGVDPFDPAQAADGAARYLSEQFRAFGSVELALAAYNAGPGNVRKYGGIPPFTETRNYVRRVMETMGAMR